MRPYTPPRPAAPRAARVDHRGADQRRVARARGQAAPKTGAVTFVQRFGGLVNLDVHLHLVVPG
jgi:hypothetical protein